MSPVSAPLIWPSARLDCRVEANLFFLYVHDRKLVFAKLAQKIFKIALNFKIAFSSGVGVKFAQSYPANGKQKPILGEMSQTLLTNKKQGNLD
jgi:hypothetical protein